MAIINKILSATDCSEPTVDAMRFAIELAKKFEAKLSVLHVAAPPIVNTYSQVTIQHL